MIYLNERQPQFARYDALIDGDAVIDGDDALKDRGWKRERDAFDFCRQGREVWLMPTVE
jgi:hypothetical protein